MRRLLITTALATALGAGAGLAQTTDTGRPAAPMAGITAPEGFVRQDIVLTAEDLLGATIHDVTGESIGEVHDLVFDLSGASTPASPPLASPPASATPPASGMPSATAPSAGTGSGGSGSGTGAEGVATGGASSGGSGTDAAATGGSATTTPDASGSMSSGTAPSTDIGTSTTTPDASGATATGTAPSTDSSTASGTTTAPGAGPTAAPGTSTATGTAGSGSMTAGSGTGTSATTGTAGAEGGRITHAVLDVGGFLGMGEHRVAVPIGDLAIYRSGTETRVYLPWTREQLEAVPAYDASNPATLGRSALPASN